MRRLMPGLWSALSLVLPSRQRRLIFRPDTERPDAAFTDMSGTWQEVRTTDGVPLRCFFAPPPRPDGRVLLYLHGNGGHLGHRAPRLPAFRAAGFGTFLLSYRGYAGNPGQPTEPGLAHDARAAFDHLRSDGIAPERIVVWGESLGSAVATRLVAASSPDRAPAALVLETPFTSMTAIGRAMVPFLPVQLLLRDRFDSLSRIGAIACPLLVAAGARDTLTPPAMARALFDAAPDPKRLVLDPDAAHGELDAAAILSALSALLPNG